LYHSNEAINMKVRKVFDFLLKLLSRNINQGNRASK